MKKILNDYKQLNAIRTELKEFKESVKDNPLKQLENFGAESKLYEQINELREKILDDSRNLYESMPTDAKAVEFVNRFKNIDLEKEKLQNSTRTINSENGDIGLNYLKNATILQQTKNDLIEEIINNLTSIQPSKARKKKI